MEPKETNPTKIQANKQFSGNHNEDSSMIGSKQCNKNKESHYNTHYNNQNTASVRNNNNNYSQPNEDQSMYSHSSMCSVPSVPEVVSPLEPNHLHSMLTQLTSPESKEILFAILSNVYFQRVPNRPNKDPRNIDALKMRIYGLMQILKAIGFVSYGNRLRYESVHNDGRVVQALNMIKQMKLLSPPMNHRQNNPYTLKSTASSSSSSSSSYRSSFLSSASSAADLSSLNSQSTHTLSQIGHQLRQFGMNETKTDPFNASDIRKQILSGKSIELFAVDCARWLLLSPYNSNSQVRYEVKGEYIYIYNHSKTERVHIESVIKLRKIRIPTNNNI